MGGEWLGKENCTMSATAMSKARRGFALLDPERLREISSKAGKTSQANGTAHRFTKAEASKYGKVGGRNSGLIRREKKAARERASEEG